MASALDSESRGPKWDLEKKNGLGNGIGTHPPPPLSGPSYLRLVLPQGMTLVAKIYEMGLFTLK